MKIAINILKAIELIITAIWVVVCGILGPLTLMYGDIVPNLIADHYIMRVWLINSVVCYLAGTVIVMLKYYKVALCFHTLGMAVSIFIYGVFSGIYDVDSAQSPAQLYMPAISLFFLTLFITLIANFKQIKQFLTASKEKKYEPAPSVLGGEYTAKMPEKQKHGNDKGKKKRKGK